MMKDKKIRILSLVAAGISLLSVVPIMFQFLESPPVMNYYNAIWGIQFYTNPENWGIILAGCLGLVSLIWNLAFGAYAAIDGRYKELIWKIARYGYFFGAVAGVTNFALMISYAFVGYTLKPMWYVFLVLLAAAVTLEILLIITKTENTKNAEI